MDLQSMQKKVKTHVYKSKQDFASDLHLIWDNCLTYNSDPVSLILICCLYCLVSLDDSF